jgi:hypothetical protein
VDFVVCTLAVKKKKAGFDLSDRTIPSLVATTFPEISLLLISLQKQFDLFHLLQVLKEIAAFGDNF